MALQGQAKREWRRKYRRRYPERHRQWELDYQERRNPGYRRARALAQFVRIEAAIFRRIEERLAESNHRVCLRCAKQLPKGRTKYCSKQCTETARPYRDRKAYRELNRDRLLAQRAGFRKIHRDGERIRHRFYAEDNRSAINERARAYREKLCTAFAAACELGLVDPAEKLKKGDKRRLGRAAMIVFEGLGVTLEHHKWK